MAKHTSFRVGQVRADLRGKVWYLTYFEDGRRRRPRVGSDKDVARQMAAQVHSQWEVSAPAALTFEAVSLDELPARWLRHHEQVWRSSVQTINRYRTATKHLLDLIDKARVPRTTSHFRSQHAEEFVRYLRTIEVSPNGHPNSKKRSLLDKGIKFILEACRAMFNFAMKRRHLSPDAENPFSVSDLDRIPVEHRRPIVVFSADEEQQFFQQCDDWQFPIFATLIRTGMRSGELCQRLLPEDVDLTDNLRLIPNKPKLGWQVKTRTERAIPLIPVLSGLWRFVIGKRQEGPVCLRRRFVSGALPRLGEAGLTRLEHELADRIARSETELQRTLSRQERMVLARHLWTDAGAVKPDRLRTEFLRVTRAIGQSHQTAPKLFRHLFATSLPDANVDPLRRGRRHMGKRKRDLYRLADLICVVVNQAHRDQPLPMFPDFAWDVVLTWRRHLEFAQSRAWFAAAVECRQELDSALPELVDQANTARQRVREIDEDSAKGKAACRFGTLCDRATVRFLSARAANSANRQREQRRCAARRLGRQELCGLRRHLRTKQLQRLRRL